MILSGLTAGYHSNLLSLTRAACILHVLQIYACLALWLHNMHTTAVASPERHSHTA